MPTLDEHQSGDFTKLIFIGDSGTGKTGALVSLLEAGYSMKIIDMDNGLDALVYFARASGTDLSKVEYETFRDSYRATKTGPMLKGSATAFVNAMEQMTKWSEVSDPRTVFVLDSLTHLGRAAFEWARGMNPTAKDPRQWFHTAQQGVLSILALVTSKEFQMNVIVISHVNYKELTEGVAKGHPSAVGTALGPQISSFFNTLVLAESSGSGTNTRRKIKTMPTGVIDLKVPNPTIEKELPLETGLATLFAHLKGQP